jgi:hypothetical protein
VKLWESIMDLSHFELNRNRRIGCGGKRERISVNKSDGRSAMGRLESDESNQLKSSGC